MRTALLAAGLALACGSAAAEDGEAAPLPDPLSLEQAFALADAGHPALERARAEVEEAEAGTARARSAYGVRVDLEAGLKARELARDRTGGDAGPGALERTYDFLRSGAQSGSYDLGTLRPAEPTGPDYGGTNDSHARLVLSKRLYDFGRTDAAVDAALSRERAGRSRLLSLRQQRRLEIMEHYFDVLLADLEAAWRTESMAAAFVDFDKAQDRHELGQVSDVELLRLESRYQALRLELRRAEGRQRAGRSRLAIALNRPEQLPADLEEPDLPALERERGEVGPLTERALADNPRLRALRAEVEALTDRLRAERRGNSPVLSAQLEAAAYANPGGSDDELSAALVLEWPLYAGGRVKAEAARAASRLRQRRAELAEAELEVRQAVLDLWLELDGLRVEMEEVGKLEEFQELDLDRRRTLYALEVTADLGDAMAETTRVWLRRAETEFNIALAWARLDALTGRLPLPGGAAPPGPDDEGEAP